ncbi:MAG: hypothetical protein V8Q79_04045 [Christensenellales bacterium]
MTYFPNVRVEVLETGDAFVRVRIGEEGSGCMEGYMPAENLAYGEEGVRAVLGRIVEYSSPNAVILYAERNTKSSIIQSGIDLVSANAWDTAMIGFMSAGGTQRGWLRFQALLTADSGKG